MDKVVFLLALIALVRCQVPQTTSEAPLPVTGNASDVAGSVVSTPQTPIPDPPLPSPTPAVDPSPPKSPELAARTAADLAALGLGGTNQPWNLFNKQAPYDLTQIARNLPPTPQVNMFGLPSGGGFDLGSAFDPFGSMFSTPNFDSLFGGFGGAFGSQQSSPNLLGLGTGSGSGNNMLQMMMLLQRLGAGAAAAADAPDPPNPTSPPTGVIRGMRGGFPGAFQGAFPGVRQRFHPRGAAPPVRGRQAGAGTAVEAGEAAEGVTPAAGASGSEFNAIDNLIAMEEQRQRRNRMKAQARMNLPMRRRPGGGNPFAGQPSGAPYPNYPNNAGPNPYQNQGPYRDMQGPYASGQRQYQSSSSQGSQPNAYTYPTEPPIARRPPPPPRGEPSNIPYPQLSSSPAANTQASWNSPPSQGSLQAKHPEILDRRNSAYTTSKPPSANQGQVPEPVEVERQGLRKQAGGTTPKPTPMIPKSKPLAELSNIPPIPDPNVPNLPSLNTTPIPSQTDIWSQSPDPNAQTAIGTPMDSWPQMSNSSRDQPYRGTWAQASSQSWGADPSRSMPPSDRARGQSNTDPWMQGPDGRWGSNARQDVPPRDQGWGSRSSAPQQSWQDQWSQFNQQQYPQDLGRASSSYPQTSQPLNRFASPPRRPTPSYPNPGQLRNQIQSNFHKMFLGAGADPVAARNMRIKGSPPSANTATGTEAANAADLQADQADMMADRLDNMQSVNPMQTMMQGVADPSLMGGFSGMGGNAFGGANAGMGMQGAASGGGMGDSMMRMALLSRLLGGGSSGIGSGAGATSGFGMNPMLAMMAGGAGM